MRSSLRGVTGRLRKAAAVLMLMGSLSISMSTRSWGSDLAACLAWHQIRAPGVGETSRLEDVSGASATDIWAVGDDGIHPVIEHWNGEKWAVVPSPGLYDYLYGVRAFATDDVWAVGNGLRGVVVLHWDGARWRPIEVPQPGDYPALLAIDGTSASDIWAAGDYTSPDGIKGLAEHYDGTSWTVVPMDDVSPMANVIQGVEAIAPDDVWAVGYQQIAFGVNQPLAQHWDGESWTAVPIDPLPGDHNVFEDVSASSSTDVWAVGSYGEDLPLMEHWDGTAWTQYPAPAQHRVIGVKVISPTNAWAGGTGGRQPSSWHWNGNSWFGASTPRVGTVSVIVDLEAISEQDIWAVGNYNPPQGGGQRPLVLRSRGVCR